MAFNKDSNGFTFGFAILMVVVVGVALASLSLTLKEPIKKNEAEKKMMDILASIGVESTRANAGAMFAEYVKERIEINPAGEVVNKATAVEVDPQDVTDPFNADVKKDYKKSVSSLVQSYKNDRSKLLEEVAKIPEDQLRQPLFICEKDGETIYVVPMGGTGLWGPIWGYVALEADGRTIYGASFDHKTETPGLGAEIKEGFFEDAFVGETTYNDKNEFTSVKVVKGGASPDDKSAVDGITGGTITSNGVDEMVYRTLAIYKNYFEKNIASI